MIDTQRIQSAPRCIAGIAEVAATLARGHEDRCTHAIEVTTCFPLDVETVGRVLEGLDERVGIDVVVSDQIAYLYIARPDDYNLRVLDLDEGEHLHSNVNLMKHLAALRSDAEWVRKVHEQHEIMRIAATAPGKTKRLDLAYFTSRTELVSARILSTLNDLSASGYILTDIEHDPQHPYYIFPDFDYPRQRYQHNMNLLDELRPSQERNHHVALFAALVLTLLIAAIVLGSMLHHVS